MNRALFRVKKNERSTKMKLKLLNIGILSTCCTLAMSNVAFALVPTIGGYMSRGVSNMCYYVDSTASAYTTYINTGISRWTNGGHSPSDFINMTAVSSNYATAVDYYAYDENEFLSLFILAETSFFSSSGMSGSGVSPYYYTEISINKGSFPDCTSYEKIGTMAH